MYTESVDGDLVEFVALLVDVCDEAGISGELVRDHFATDEDESELVIQTQVIPLLNHVLRKLLEKNDDLEFELRKVKHAKEGGTCPQDPEQFMLADRKVMATIAEILAEEDRVNSQKPVSPGILDAVRDAFYGDISAEELKEENDRPRIESVLGCEVCGYAYWASYPAGVAGLICPNCGSTVDLD